MVKQFTTPTVNNATVAATTAHVTVVVVSTTADMYLLPINMMLGRRVKLIRRRLKYQMICRNGGGGEY